MITKNQHDIVPKEVVQPLFGIAVSYIACSCIYCGYLNRSIAAPQNSPIAGYYHQKNATGTFVVPVLCDKCGKNFFVVWDEDPM